MPRTCTICAAAALIFTAAAPLLARQPAASPAASVHRGVELVASGRCREALPLLKRTLPQLADKSLRYDAQMAIVRCAMALDQQQTAAETLLALEHESPGDPEVLYIATHLFSELGMRAAQQLQATAPDSYQEKRLEAETLESQGKNDEAAAVYRGILASNPKVPGIHYRLGQIGLALAGGNGPTAAAQQEFQKELEVDPT